jgi:hypothetical protein
VSNPTPSNPPADPTQHPTPPASGNGGTPPPAAQPTPAPLTMTQAELDSLIADRLARQQRAIDAKTSKERADAEAAQLAEQGKYKELADRAVAEAETLKAQLAARDHADLQREVAAEHKLPAEMAPRLQGSTRDELAADAKGLAKLLTPATPPPPTPGNRPNPRPQAGPDAQDKTEQEMRASGRYQAL